ncbi:MAG: hypothetical protein O2985_16915, partial [Proteobacteria bacterium]|nr:hypothetical protein [Pseudomonadota bacterium]
RPTITCSESAASEFPPTTRHHPDKPLHGELKLPGMADDFYKRQVDQHLDIGFRAMELLRTFPPEKLHSRKLRSFNEVPIR